MNKTKTSINEKPNQKFHSNINSYLRDVTEIYTEKSGQELAKRGPLWVLLNEIIKNLPENHPHKWLITNEPNRMKNNAPDYDVQKNGVQIGFFETKEVGDTDLRGNKETKNKDQFDRYKKAMGNICFTDYLTFIFYDGVKEIGEVSIAKLENKKNIIPLPENYDEFIRYLENFTKQTILSIKDPLDLAEKMALQAQHLSFAIFNAIAKDEADKATQTSLWKQYKSFQVSLVRDLTFSDFSDSLAQTIIFGLFTARKYDKTKKDFYREEVLIRLPNSMPFLRDFFNHIVSNEFDMRITVLIDKLIALFLATDMDEVFKDFGKESLQEDPIIHFYETFLSLYNPAMRKARGVWYTPRPVVNYIVRAVDDLLINEFDIKDGLGDNKKIEINVKEATSLSISKRTKKLTAPKETYKKKEVHRVQVLDPACGTGAFLSETFKHIKAKLYQKKGGSWTDDIENDILPRLNAFEILMASYAIAHLHMHMELQETGYIPSKDHKRMNIFLTNSLEANEHFGQATLEFDAMLAREAEAADYVKRDVPVMVVIGNPPYSGESSNKNNWIDGLMDDYKKEPGRYDKNKIPMKLIERNPKWINDDYVKFLRLGQYYIEKNKLGILAFINPHGYLDNPTFRGMRWHLLKTYDKIYTIDLHGNSKKKETAPDGGRDENVFDIMQGVSINLFVKTGKKKPKELAQVFHCDLFGKREMKYDFLLNNSINSTPFQPLENVAPNYFFVPKDFGLQKKYDKGFAINELFKINSVGIVTAKDFVLIADNKEKLSYQIKSHFSIDARFELIQEVAYRLFDNRFVYYDIELIERAREKTTHHFIKKENWGLTLCKQFKTGDQYVHSFITNKIIESSFVSNRTSEITSVFPLYLYPENPNPTLIDDNASRTPNLDKTIINAISQGLGLIFSDEKSADINAFAPIDILDYCYAVLHSPSYRETYKEFLKINFPKIPYPINTAEFWRLVILGKRLRQLHLLEDESLKNIIQDYPVSGSNEVQFIEYKDNKVWINKTQYFDEVPLIAWEFYIGGYQPAQKWLKDRKGMRLSGADCDHYRKIIIALTETEKTTKLIDLKKNTIIKNDKKIE